MKKLFVSLALASSVLVAGAPASAQYNERDRYDDRRYDDRYDRGQNEWNRFGYRGEDLRPRLNRIGQQISRGVQRGFITDREAYRLRQEVTRIWRLSERFYASRGYDPRERAELDRRINWLQDQVRFERRDDDRRWR